MERILLQLASSSEQEAALEQLLVEQQDPASPRYHAWLTPEEFGEQFGVARQDLDALTAWLVAQGFQVTEVAAGRRSIEFSGTAAQVEAAFHTEIDRYEWKGRPHVANAGDISIPAAFATVVRGVVSLHDFGLRPFHHVIASAAAPLTNFSGGVHGLSPYDFATIYDLTPLWNAGYDGTGQSIAVVGETDIKASDVAGFRTLWGLGANSPIIIVNGKDPGIVSGDETEADLDVEWAGAVAKGASVYFVTSASTNTSDGVTLSAQYVVQHDTAPVMSLSYGMCEAQLGSSNYFYNSLWQQAAAEGIAIFAAAGDSGSAGCDASNDAVASQGFGINGLASTTYNVAVGGTEFNDASSSSTYWSPNNNAQMASALGYIPEVVWNESSTAGGSGLYAGGGGSSLMWNRGSWQTGAGVPTGTARLTPDISLSAAGHDGYVIEQEGGLYLVGGTSAATPSFAGLMAIVNQYTHTGNGNPVSKLYALAASAPGVFHDITAGSNAVACAAGSPNCSTAAAPAGTGKMTGYNAGSGYDLATGLGTVDANALVTNWSGTPPAPTIVSLSPNPINGSSAAQSLTIKGSGFVAGSDLLVKVGSVTYQGASVTFVSSSQLVVSVNVGTSAQSVAVQVTLPSGKATTSATLTVIASSIPPSIVSLSPNPMTGSSSAQTLSVNGSGFVSGGALKVSVGSTVYQGPQVTFVSGTQLTVSVTVGAAAQTLSVVVIDPNGLASSAATLTVTAPPRAPAVYALAPNPMAASNSAQVLTVTGSGFTPGTGLKVSVGNVVYQGSQIVSASSSLLTVSVVPGTVAQNLPVEVSNPTGQVSNPVNLTVSAAPAPIVTSLNPNPMTGSNSAQMLIVGGSGFVSGSGLKVTVGGTVYQGSQINSAAGTQLMLSLVAGTTAQTLPVTVTNPSGAMSAPVNLTVSAPAAAPTIASLNPNPMTGSNSAQTLTINGSGFQAGLKVSIAGTTLTASQLAVLTPTQLQLNVITGLTAKVYAVEVINANGGTSNSVNLQVNPPPAPMIASLLPDPFLPSSGLQVLTINGANFQPGAGLKVTVGGTLYTGSPVTFVSSSQLKVAVAITSGTRTWVQVTNPNGIVSNSVPLIVM